MDLPIYLDYNATTPLDPRAVEAMTPYLSERFGNPSSDHVYGHAARRAMDAARDDVAALLGARSDEIVFTGGGSESDNLAIKGVVLAHLHERPHVVSTSVEHPAVLATLRYFQKRFEVTHTLVAVDEFGAVAPRAVRDAFRPETILVTVMHANNEVGTIQPIEEIARYTREAGISLHVDAAQSAGKIPVDVDALGADLLTLAGHKLYGPKGIGALFVRDGIHLEPLVHGALQENGLRAGTENVPSMVGLGQACAIARDVLTDEASRLQELRDLLHRRLGTAVPGLLLNGHPSERLPNTLNVSFPGVRGHDLLAHVREVAASTGSACHAGQADPSPVLTAMGIERDRALGAVRLSLGRWSTRDEVERAASLLAEGYVAVLGRSV